MYYNESATPKLRLHFYPGGDKGPVEAYLIELRDDSQRKAAFAKLTHDLATLEMEGLFSKQLSVERIRGVPGSVWELRRAFDGIKYRIYFCVRAGEAWILHYLEKKSAKIPPHDLRLIRKRAKEVLR